MKEELEEQLQDDFIEQSPVVQAYEEANSVYTAMKEINKLINEFKSEPTVVSIFNEALKNVQGILFKKLIQEHAALAEIIEKE